MIRLTLLMALLAVGPLQALPPAQLVFVKQLSGVVVQCDGEVHDSPHGKFGYYWVWLKNPASIKGEEMAKVHSVLETKTTLKCDQHRKPAADEVLLVIPTGQNGYPELEKFEPGDRVSVSGYGIWPSDVDEDDPKSGEPGYYRMVVTRSAKGEEGGAEGPEGEQVPEEKADAKPDAKEKAEEKVEGEARPE